tara:strand:- start:1692 stop:1925 length:234 start_codon:yes stop_codon:yes gene_type:complete
MVTLTDISVDTTIGNKMVDFNVKNDAANDIIHISTTDNEWDITVYRDTLGTHVIMTDKLAGSHANYILGKEGYTQKA